MTPRARGDFFEGMLLFMTVCSTIAMAAVLLGAIWLIFEVAKVMEVLQ
jgi:F0F1-type ATP synthase membrane subunit c/vacuolar-type H+-ATPase subunit K